MKANGTASSQFRKKQVLAVSGQVVSGNTSSTGVYEISPTGFGTKCASYSQTYTTSNGNKFDITANKYMLFCINQAVFAITYNWSLDNGFGSQISTPTNPSGGSFRSIGMNTAGTVFSFASNNSPYNFVYPFDNGYGTKYSDPATLPDGDGYTMSFNSTDSVAFQGLRATGNYTNAWAWNNTTGFGTKYANPTATLTSTSVSAIPNKKSTWLITGGANNAGISAIAWNNTTGFGTTYAPAGSVTGPGSGTSAYSPAEQYVAKMFYGNNISGTAIGAYAWNFNTDAISANPFGSRFSDPSTTTSSAAAPSQYGNIYLSTGNAAAVPMTYSPFVNMWPWTNSGFGSRFSDPTTVISATVNVGTAVNAN